MRRLSCCRGLSLLQHRGRESCGLIVGRGDAFRACAGVGTVAEGLDEQALASLGVGRCAAGYVRGVGAASAFVAEHAALVLEGYLTNGDKLREVLAGRGVFAVRRGRRRLSAVYGFPREMKALGT